MLQEWQAPACMWARAGAVGTGLLTEERAPLWPSGLAYQKPDRQGKRGLQKERTEE